MEKEAKDKFKCNGDCLNCRMNPVERRTQWQYCATQFTYNTMRMVETIQFSLEAMNVTVSELQSKIEAMQNNEALVFDPTHEEKSEITIAQEGSGVE